MEKSIESIWKTGFLNNGPLAVPIINDLYNRKSIHAIDKYNKRFKLNIKALFVVSFVVLFGSFLVGVPVMGIPMFLMFNIMVIADKKLLKKQEQLVKGTTCYEYIKSLNDWMNLKTKWNIRIARIMYPVMITSIMLGQWFLSIDGTIIGEIITHRLYQVFPEMTLVFGIPLLGLVGLALLAGVSALFAEKLYRWDLEMGYGNLLRKLDELMADMEKLRS